MNATTQAAPQTELSDEQVFAMFNGKSEEDIGKMWDSDKATRDALRRFTDLIDDNRQPDKPGAAKTQATREDGVIVKAPVIAKINPDWLTTYLTPERTPEEAVQELAKGKTEADKTINFFKDHKLPLVERERDEFKQENLSLRQQIAEYNRKREEDEKKAKTQPSTVVASVPEDEVIPELPDDFDALDADHVAILVNRQKAIEKKLSRLSKPEEPKPLVETPAIPAQRAVPAPRPQVNSVDREFQEIRMLQAHPEFEEYLKTQKDIAVLSKEYENFFVNLAQANGVREVMDSNGNYVPESTQIANAYLDPNNSNHAAIKARADSLGIKPPEETDKLLKILKVRSTRYGYQKSGSQENIPYDEAARILRANNPQLFKSEKLANAVADAERHARAVENRNQFAREPRANDGADPSQQSTAALSRFEQLVQKGPKNLTEQDRAEFRDVAKTLQLSDMEIAAWLKTR
jgi:hypothetical protein